MYSQTDVGILGATGNVGQQFIAQLDGHPFFRTSWLAASERSEGRRLSDLAWRVPRPMPASAGDLRIDAAQPGRGPRLVFSALDSSVAGPIETAFAEAGHIVISNSRNHRMDPLVPLVVPEVNPDHLELLVVQRRVEHWDGAIVTNPNCSTVFLAMALGAVRQFRPTRVLVTTLQAVSGAGYPGVASLDILGNVIPAIEGEEEKMETETRKILGAFRRDRVDPHAVVVSAQTTRVPVADGHTETVSVAFEERPSLEDVRAAFETFVGRPQQHHLPTAPIRPIVYLDQPNRPQPRLDAEAFGGMVVHVGRLRPCAVLDFKFVALGHNTIRGAAGAAVLNAELMAAEGLLD